MSTQQPEAEQEVITTRIWQEISEDDNPFAARTCYLAGFDVYGDLLGKVSWPEYLYLLFKLQPPGKEQAKLLEGVAIALANPGPRDLSVRAAMSAGVGGSTRASVLMAALAVGAGNLGGGREISLVCQLWDQNGCDLARWKDNLLPRFDESEDTWSPIEHVPGFDPHGTSCPTPVLQTMEYLLSIKQFPHLFWLSAHREKLEAEVGRPLSMTGVVAAAFVDLGLDPGQAEILYLLLRLPGAAVHALEQEKGGWGEYPFFGGKVHVTNDPYRDQPNSGGK